MSVQSKNTTGALVARDWGKGRSGARGMGAGEGRGGGRGGGTARICTYNYECDGLEIPVYYPEGHGRSYCYRSNGRDFGGAGDKVFPYMCALTTENMRGTLVTTGNGCKEWSLHQGRCLRKNCSKYHLHPGHVASNLPRRDYQAIGTLHDDLLGDRGIKDRCEWSSDDVCAAGAINKAWKTAKIATLKRESAKRKREAELAAAPMDAEDLELQALMKEKALYLAKDRIKMQKVHHVEAEPTYLDYNGEQEAESEPAELECEEEGFGAEAPGEQHFVVVKTEPQGDEELVVDEDDVENAKATTPAAQDATATTAQDAETLKIMSGLSNKPKAD
jgi:hypothetical protein